jgi:hypothetical protein
VTDGGGVTLLSTGAPQGYGPANFRAAYNNRGTAPTHVGVVTAYDTPRIQADLATFSKRHRWSRVLSLPAALYANSANIIRDITTGSNGSGATYLCKAGAGYDGPTGLGVLSRP